MHYTYTVNIDPIYICNKEMSWDKFQKLLYRMVIAYKSEDSLEADIITTLINSVDILHHNIISLTNYLNKYYSSKRNESIVNIIEEGIRLYNRMRDLIQECSEEYYSKNDLEHWFIKELLGLNGYFLDIVLVLDKILLWNKYNTCEFNKYDHY